MNQRRDYENYLIRLYFGNDEDFLKACINRAYLDFNRTIHGLDQLKLKDQLHKKVSSYIKSSFSNIQTGITQLSTQEEFDNWHQLTCEDIRIFYSKYDYDKFYIGQSQKWINMTFKYIFTMGEERIKGFSTLYRLCHIPLDNIILNRLRDKYAYSGISCAWSRLKDYNEYLSCQKWIRQKFSDVPLDFEFNLWMSKIIPMDVK